MILKAFGLFLITNDPDLFKRWLYGGIEDLGEPAGTELLLDWIDPFITRVDSEYVESCYLSTVIIKYGIV